jgi:hypothetical protein
MDMKYVGAVLLLLIAIFFLFRLGHALATRYFNESFFPWLGTLFLVLAGWGWLNQDNLMGFLGFIPICTYIFLKMADGLSWGTPLKKRAQGICLSAGSSVVIYMVTHFTFGFGIPEASVSAIVAAGILGLAGYTA